METSSDLLKAYDNYSEETNNTQNNDLGNVTDEISTDSFVEENNTQNITSSDKNLDSIGDDTVPILIFSAMCIISILSALLWFKWMERRERLSGFNYEEFDPSMAEEAVINDEDHNLDPGNQPQIQMVDK